MANNYNSDDSDYELIHEHDFVTTGYKPLREEVETVLIHNKCDENAEKRKLFLFGDTDMTPIENSDNRMKFNLSCDKLFKEKNCDLKPVSNIKKSKSENFSINPFALNLPIKKDNIELKRIELKSPSLVRKNLVKNQTPKVENSVNVIYDIPKKVMPVIKKIEIDGTGGKKAANRYTSIN